MRSLADLARFLVDAVDRHNAAIAPRTPALLLDDNIREAFDDLRAAVYPEAKQIPPADARNGMGNFLPPMRSDQVLEAPVSHRASWARNR